MSAQPNMRGTSRLSRQRGLTLIELMVALVIGLILTGGVIQIFIGSQQTYRFQESLSRIQENGRFAMEMLARDLRGADYRGCGGHSTELDSILKTGLSEDHGFAGGQGLRGHSHNGGWTPALDAEVAAQEPHEDSDIIRAFTADGAGIEIIDTNFNNANLDLEPGGGDRFQEGDIVWATDCNDATEFQITKVQNDATKLVHAASGDPGNESPPKLPRSYTGGQVLSFNARAYYIATSASDASDEPALFRLDRGGSPEELVEGVERMSLMFGEDTSGDRQVNRYRTAPEIEGDDAWPNVVAVRISLLLRGAEENVTDDDQSVSFPPGTAAQTFDDRRLRQVFTTTVAIRNRLQ